MHLDIWSPGNVLNEHENGGKVLNCMCDLTQFIVFCMLIDTRAKALSYFFYGTSSINIRHGCRDG